MKKLGLIFALILLLAGCGGEDKDPYASYRGETATIIFEGGEKDLAKDNYTDAIKQFEALDAIYPFGPYAQQGQLDVIYAYYKSGDDASAIAAADRYIRLYPRGKNADYAYYIRGIIGFSEGLSWLQKMAGVDPASRDVSKMQRSFVAFATLVHQFPHSRYRPDALRRLAYIRNLMARRQVNIADFYYRHRAYIAAANRASIVVQHFQGSSQMPNALGIMVKSYRSLGLKKMAKSMYRVLQVNYPDSSETHDLEDA